ncbi:MAG: hypothetical protein JWM87_2739 [Candidatus Eremiobacteraeota bacterium]|nr:hypothetical protein [Candidatus Eremiobacteraeota bacterium]
MAALISRFTGLSLRHELAQLALAFGGGGSGPVDPEACERAASLRINLRTLLRCVRSVDGIAQFRCLGNTSSIPNASVTADSESLAERYLAGGIDDSAIIAGSVRRAEQRMEDRHDRAVDLTPPGARSYTTPGGHDPPLTTYPGITPRRCAMVNTCASAITAIHRRTRRDARFSDVAAASTALDNSFEVGSFTAELREWTGGVHPSTATLQRYAVPCSSTRLRSGIL